MTIPKNQSFDATTRSGTWEPLEIPRVTEHLIRFRRGWRCLDSHGDELPGLLTLPTPTLRKSPNPLRLVRSFQLPALNRDREALWLDLESVPGLTSIELNGRDLPRPDQGSAVERILLDRELLPRNRLVLQVDTERVTFEDWGVIALVIRDRRPSPVGGSEGH